MGRSKRRQYTGGCARCGYDLSGTPPRLPCPECGADPALARAGDCALCGYDLSATPGGAPCPECGSPAVYARTGTLLPMAGESDLRRLARGASLLSFACAIPALVPILAFAFGILFAFGSSGVLAEAVGISILVGWIAGGVALLVCWWLGWRAVVGAMGSTTASGAFGDSPRWLRRSVACAAIASGVGAVLTAVAGGGAVLAAERLAPGSMPVVVSEVAVRAVYLATLAAFTWSAGAGMLLARNVLMRTSARAAQKRARPLVWLSPVIFLGFAPPAAGTLTGGTFVEQSAGCLVLVAWLWFIFAASVMILLRREALRGQRLKRQIGLVTPASDPPQRDATSAVD